MKNRLKQFSLLALIATLGIFIACKSDDGGIKIASDLAIDFDSPTASVAESGSAITVTVSFPEAPTDINVTASVTGTATYTTDYTTTPAVSGGNLTFAISEGDTEASFTFTPVDNNATDGSRTAIFTLQAATGIELGTNTTATVTITDDDAAGISSIDEDFESTGLADGDVFAMTDWLNAAEAGTHYWEYEEYSGNGYLEFTSYNTGENSNIGWLVLPKINFDDLAVDEMSFWNQIGYGDVNTLFELYYSTDFDGGSSGITTATWTELSFNISTEDNDWVESGAIDLSAISGNGYLAFKYTGNTNSDNDASYRIDNLRVGVAAPSVTVTESLTDFGSVDNGSSSSEQSFTIEGVGITGDVTVTAPLGFEVSKTTWNTRTDVEYSSITFSDVSSPQTVYVRFTPISGTNQAISGDITVSADGMIDRVTSVSGTETGNVETPGLLFENFDYGSSAGDLTTVSAGNWVAHSGAGNGPAAYITTGLSLSGYAASGVGGSMTNNVSGSEDVNRSYAEQTSGTVYAGGLFNFSEATTNGDYFFHLKDASFGLYGRVYVKDDGSGNLVFGLREGSGGTATILYSTTGTVWSKNTTYLLVLKYDFTLGAATLYVSDAMMATEPSQAEVTIDDADNATTLSSVGFRQGSNTPNFNVDGIIVTNTWADFVVTPE